MMKLCHWLLLVVGASASLHSLTNHVNHVLSALAPAPSNATKHFYTSAVLDHFLTSVASPAPSPKWRQRFYVDQTHWCGTGCPVFVYIGGEGPQAPPSPRLFMNTLASEAGALMVALEHRFFGESYPTPDMSD